MTKPSIFIGCASESREVADALAEQLEDAAEITVYDEGPFGLSTGTLADLNEATDKFDFAILVLTANDLTTSREVEQPAPRDNILFELGLFMGRLGPHRTFIVYDRSARPKLPSDLAGVTLAEYGSRADGNLVAAVRTACRRIRQNVQHFGSLDIRGPRESRLPGDGRVMLREGRDEDWIRDVELRRRERERSVRLDGAVLSVIHGRIQEWPPEEATAIVLPANEFFDDECINDSRSSLGAFVQSQFGAEQIPELAGLVRTGLAERPSSEVEKRRGIILPSYGIGTCVFLDRVLGSDHRLILTSITTDRDGLRSEMGFLFKALRGVLATMAEHRLRRVVMPLLGSGHGCLRPDVSLLAITLALAELARSEAGRRLTDATVVVFERPNGKTDLPMSAIERILTTAAAIAG